MSSIINVPALADLSDVQLGAISRPGGKDQPSIDQVERNYDNLSIGDKKKLIRYWFSYYKSIAVPLNKIDAVIRDNERKSGVKNVNSAPLKDQRAIAPEWKRLMTDIMSGVDEDFQNWATLTRGIQKDLMKPARALFALGMTDNKKVAKKGAFIYFLSDDEMLVWFGVMVTMGNALMDWITGGANLNVTGKAVVPGDKEGWMAYIEKQAKANTKLPNGKLEIVPAPNIHDVQVYFNEALNVYAANGSLTEAIKLKYDMMLEVFTMLRPSRLFPTQDGVRRSVIPLSVSQPVMRGFAAMYEQVKDIFTLAPVNVSVKLPIDMNKNTADILRIYNNFIPQFRTYRRGGEAGRLGKNESRKFVEFKMVFN